MLTKGRVGLLKLDWVSLSVIAILLCTFVAHCGIKSGWGATEHPSGRISDWGTQKIEYPIKKCSGVLKA